jgi:glycosyltransferase involved in cell wall biosynthesis
MPKNQANPPLVSIVMATYNGELFLTDQIDSLLQQDYPNLELIIVDDASTDQTVPMLAAYAAADSRIRLFQNERNIGYIKTFERGLSLAQGSFISLSDQDDVWLPGKISRLMEAIGDHPLVYSDSVLIDAGGNSLGRKLSQQKRLTDFSDCLSYAIGGSAPGHAMLCRKELIDRCFPFPDIFPHDYWIGFRATCMGTMKYLDVPLTFYRQHRLNVFGAGKSKRRQQKKKSDEQLRIRQQQINLLAEVCPEQLPQKRIYQRLAVSYQGWSLLHNLTRLFIFYRYRDSILAYKHRSYAQKLMFVAKTFFKRV